MRAPWRINFPTMRDPWSHDDVLVLRKDDIRDARPGVLPSRCWITGQTRDGRRRRFIAPIVDFERACRAPVHLVQVDDLVAPAGQLVNAAGQLITHLRTDDA